MGSSAWRGKGKPYHEKLGEPQKELQTLPHVPRDGKKWIGRCKTEDRRDYLGVYCSNKMADESGSWD